MSATDQVQRLLTMVPYLLKHPGATVKAVAEVFGLSEQQVLDDLQVVYWCGLPGLAYGDLIEIDLEAAKDGGVINLRNADYLARPLRLTPDEAAALLVAVRALREVAGPAERDVIDTTVAKLTAAAGEGARAADRAEVRVWSADETIRGTVEDGLSRHRQLLLTYDVASRAETTVRVVDPLRLRLTDGYVYLDAWCHRAGALRNFRLDRVAAVELLDTPAQPHPEIRLPDPEEGWLGRFGDAPVVTVDLLPEAHWVAEYYPVLDDPEPRAGGVLRVRLPVTSPDWLRALLLRLGPDARLVDPPEAGQDAGLAAAEALAQYHALFGPEHGAPPAGSAGRVEPVESRP